MKAKLEHIFTRLICGGTGYAPMLFRYKDKYYTLVIGINAERIKNPVYPEKQLMAKRDKEIYDEFISPLTSNKDKSNGCKLWLKHRVDNAVSAEELYKIIK